ncbi:hypothetical protein [Pseudotamlana carrageenivorans]|uniref:Phage tail collar domain-containing protein n=1 Tax=Pseudotamlana carrageenivorans TaxID=2069432 RepID=A0A2I7SKT3_9FLAO|nr:hypothetical protein [Tamlana carrageenivorans]AUS06490.1 hypothetical protein C1A40_14010 [Tamlana carrageenivorans]
MNSINFNQVGGFPLEAEILSDMQSAYELLQCFGDVIGAKSIIKGCTVTGSTVSDGVIYWDGEVLEFKGGLAESKIVIIETKIQLPFEDGNIKDVYIKRHAEFGTGIGEADWSDFKRAFPLTSALFIDEVRMYSGLVSEIPWGWYLMDGTNGTLDVRDRFPVPYNPDTADYDTIGKTGGEKEVTLTEAQMPSHTHSGTTSTNGAHTHTHQRLKVATKGESKSDAYYRVHGSDETGTTSSAGSHNHSLNIDAKGGGQPHENRPPFVALGFIQFKGV